MATLKWRHRAGFATPGPTCLPAAVLQGRPGQESLPARSTSLLWQLFCLLSISPREKKLLWQYYLERCQEWKTHLNWRIIEISFSIDRDKRCPPCCDSKHPDENHLLNFLLRHIFLLFENRNQDLPRPESLVEDWPKNWGALKICHYCWSYSLKEGIKKNYV